MRQRQIILLGATGSIGTSAIKVAEAIPERMRIVGMAAHRNVAKLAAQANRLQPPVLCVADPEAAAQLEAVLSYRPEILAGEQGLVDLATHPEADLVLVAIVGTTGLRPALAALRAGKDLAVASKEILVMAGAVVMAEAARVGRVVLPVDSEHNAIFQCVENRPPEHIQNIILTASGGPFRRWPVQDLERVTPAEALKHPTWSMGPKITIDSATLFNKGLEMIEARWLFSIPMHQVQVLVHPQSIVHSLVEFTDHSILAQLSHSDMCFPIQYAVTWPDRVSNDLKPLRLAELGRLEFEEPRYDAFPALNLARAAGDEGGTLPAVLNAANEVAVAAFLQGQISFPAIWRVVAETLERVPRFASPTLDDILEADAQARCEAHALLTHH
ncbi:MAG: 1-deoxy-D-xylulose-5-phosphate reductoisomerase [Verrucomicrobia bacterium]|nr:1-deoxy-D-xylulose-5-phosphate reductoisomerase [Verrucomicrobiota bacterium]